MFLELMRTRGGPVWVQTGHIIGMVRQPVGNDYSPGAKHTLLYMSSDVEFRVVETPEQIERWARLEIEGQSKRALK